jgi:photosystem II stability/assembly factor-like uncharacterized protein
VGDTAVSGGEGIILATGDGTHWVKQVRSAGAELKGLWFVDERHGWAVGGFGTILATSDGGAHWRRQQVTLPYAEISSVCFVDEKRGWAVGNAIDSIFVLSTKDGGESWRVRPAPGRYYPFDVYFHDARRGWMVGAGGRIYETNDGGSHWRRQRSGVEPDELFLNSVAFVDRRHGWVVGGDVGGGRAVVLSTQDGGAHWSRQRVSTSEELLGVSFSSVASGWVAGRDGYVAGTVDGRRWAGRVLGVGTAQYHAVFALDDQLAYLVGDPGAIRVTRDGGLHWDVQKSGTTACLNDVFFVAP